MLKSFGSGSLAPGFRIRNQSGHGIRIRIQNPYPDPGGQKWRTKVGIFQEILYFEVLDVSFES